MSIINPWIYLVSWQIPLENQLELVSVFPGLVHSQGFIIHALAAVHPLTVYRTGLVLYLRRV